MKITFEFLNGKKETIEGDAVAKLGKFTQHEIGGKVHLKFENSKVEFYMAKRCAYAQKSKTDLTRYFPVEISQ